MDIFYIFTTALGAILGGFFGAYYNYKFLNLKYSKIRSIAIKALNTKKATVIVCSSLILNHTFLRIQGC